jgi:hypothetical protein
MTGWSKATSAIASSSTSKRARPHANRLAFGLVALVAAGAAPPAEKAFDPVAFFTGPTQGRGILKELVGKSKHTATQSVGRVDKDGTLVLDQKVAVEGDPLRQRQWRLRKTGPNRYAGTLSDAKGPLEAELVGRAWHIRYKMKGGIKVEQTLTPLPGGRAIDNRATFHKWGVKVATLTERIEKR